MKLTQKDRSHHGAKGRKPGGDAYSERKLAIQQDWALRTLIKQHEGRCTHCHELVTRHHPTDERYGVIAFIIPLDRNGQNILANMTLRCRTCEKKLSESPFSDATP